MLTRPDQFLRVLFKLAEIWHQKSNHLKVAERKKRGGGEICWSQKMVKHSRGREANEKKD